VGGDDVVIHAAYHNEFLDDIFCTGCGDYWPCLPERERTQCRCGHQQSNHSHSTGQCWHAACGCNVMRPREVTS
jgi:hypothetical protein